LVRTLDFVKVKGKKRPVMIFELIDFISNKDEKTFNFVKKFEDALENYKNREWDMAIIKFTDLYENYGDKASQLYIERILVYKNDPPPQDWDYSYTFTTK